MSGRRKKTPEDYDLIAFRVSKDERKELEDRIEAILDKKNKGIDIATHKKFKKNEILLDALKRGLRQFEGR